MFGRTLLAPMSIALAALLLPAAAEAQSFNCRNARFADEIAICESRLLSRLDVRMARLFFQARESDGGSELGDDQDAWLRTRRACGGDEDCIEEAYRERIRELREY